VQDERCIHTHTHTRVTDTCTHDNTVKKLQLLKNEHTIFNNVFKSIM